MNAPGLPPQFRYRPQYSEVPQPHSEQGKLRATLPKWLPGVAIISGIAIGIAIGLLLLTRGLIGQSDEAVDTSSVEAPPQLRVQQPSTPSARAPAASAPPERTERIVQDGWTINCAQPKANDPRKLCSAVLQVVEEQNRRVVFAWVIGKTPDGALTTVFRTPTGVQLQRGVDIKFGSSNVRRAEFVICNQQGCEAVIPMDDVMIREATAALDTNAVATVIIADGRGVNFTMPLKGIDKVFSTVR